MPASGIITLLPLGLASLLGSSVLFRHQRVLTFLAAAGALFEMQWLALTLLQRTLVPQANLPLWMSVGGMLLVALWAMQWRHASLPYREAGSGRRDSAVLLVLAVVVLAALLIANANGFVGNEWITHGFYNGDTATFVSLTQRSLITPGLVTANPFAGGGYLEYPTLLHAGVANLLALGSGSLDWLRFLPLMTYVQIALTVPLFFLLWDLLYPEPADRTARWLGVPSRFAILAAQSLLILYILGSSWDNYVYPQSHFFLTALFLLQNALLITASRARGTVFYCSAGAALLTTVVLMLSNAVTGTAALAGMMVWLGIRALQRTATLRERGGAVAAAVLLLALFVLAMPGDPTFGLPSFSYTAAHDLLIWTPLFVLLLAGVWLGYEQHLYPAAAAMALVVLAGITLSFSTRDIVVANASRFIYHAALVAWPLTLPPLIRGWYWWQREWRYSTRTLPQLAIGYTLLIAAVGGAGLLPLSSIASAHDHLMRRDRQVIDTALRQALWWIEDHAAPDSIIITAPHPPFAVPLMTGRAQLRAAYPDGSAYWLSPDDEVLADLRAAFTDDAAAQERVAAHGDYLLLSAAEREAWELLPYEKVFDTTAYVIYRLRQ